MLYPLSYWGRHERSGQVRHRVKVTGPDGFTRLGAAVPLTRPAKPRPSAKIRVFRPTWMKQLLPMRRQESDEE